MTDLSPSSRREPVPPVPAPADFLWGVATSAYQSEGGYNGPGQPQTNWAGVEATGTVMRSGAAADFWNRWSEDFRTCQRLGLNAFRLGIEWSRVQPTRDPAPGPPPPFDYAALDQYAEILAGARRCGLEPIVTLHHFVHPAWLGSDPWLDPQPAIAAFREFVRVALEHVNGQLTSRHGVAPIRYYLTVNEPNMLVLNTYLGRQFPGRALPGFHTMLRAYEGLLGAHVATYNLIHDLHASRGWPAPFVSLNNYCSDLYWSDKFLLDLLFFRVRGIDRRQVTGYLLEQAARFEANLAAAQLPLRRDALYHAGNLVKRISNWLGKRALQLDRFSTLLEAIEASPRPRLLDYVALDYYDPFAAHLFRLPNWSDFEFKSRSLRAWLMNTVTSKWWDWRVLPAGLDFFCRHYAEECGLPVLIAENGLAMRRRPNNDFSRRPDQFSRSDYLRLHVREATRIVQQGVPLIGYLHWSLFDNYEWGSFTPRFGLFSIDYQRGTDRLAEDHFHDQPSATYAQLVREARQGGPGPTAGTPAGPSYPTAGQEAVGNLQVHR